MFPASFVRSSGCEVNADDFWRDLMEEPPFGFNHGHERSHSGGWIPLGVEEQRAYEDELGFEVLERQAPRRRTHKPEDTIRHGTRSAYTEGCRCIPCRRANADYSKERRNKS